MDGDSLNRQVLDEAGLAQGSRVKRHHKDLEYKGRVLRTKQKQVYKKPAPKKQIRFNEDIEESGTAHASADDQ